MLIKLREWGEAETVLLSHEPLNALRDLVGDKLQITPGRRPQEWSIRAVQHVGAIQLGDLSILIQPKIPLDNVFLMLVAGQTALDFGTARFAYEQTDLLPALASFYERLMAETLARGVLRSYRAHEEALVAIRGRIDMPQVLRGGGMPAPIPCRFDELSFDIPENMILYTAADLLVRYPDVDPAVRVGLRRTAAHLNGVGLVDPRNIPQVHMTRLNRHYEPALRLAEVILRSGGLRDREGTVEASTFLIDMNQLFERFVTTELRRRLIGRLEVRDQVAAHLDVANRVSVWPDLVFYRRHAPVLVADLKYKLAPEGIARTGDYYQLHAYCAIFGLDTGLLIYAADSKDESQTTIRVRNTEVGLGVYPLFLGGDAGSVAAALDGLASVIAARARVRVAA